MHIGLLQYQTTTRVVVGGVVDFDGVVSILHSRCQSLYILLSSRNFSSRTSGSKFLLGLVDATSICRQMALSA